MGKASADLLEQGCVIKGHAAMDGKPSFALLGLNLYWFARALRFCIINASVKMLLYRKFYFGSQACNGHLVTRWSACCGERTGWLLGKCRGARCVQWPKRAVLGATWCPDTPGVLTQEPGEGDGERPGCRAHSTELACGVPERAGERPAEHQGIRKREHRCQRVFGGYEQLLMPQHKNLSLGNSLAV